MRLVAGRNLRTLDFDIENRPLTYLGHDFTTADITAIAWAWVAEHPLVNVQVQTKDDRSRKRMLQEFRRAYEKADIVTGHYILKHDLPIINGMLIEEGLEPLGPKLVHDTKIHLIGFKDISKSQKNLAQTLGVEAPKVDMSDPDWRAANRLTRDGIQGSIERVQGDVRQHIALRNALIERNLLRAPTLWRGGR